MFKFVNRSRSVKGVTAHGREGPVRDDQHLVSSFQSPRHRADFSQNEERPSAPIPSPAPSWDAGRSHLQLPSPRPSLYPRSPTMPDRPSTSSGPGPAPSFTSGSSIKDFDRRKSKTTDDLHVLTQTSSRGTYKSYHIPIRGKPPSPKESIRDPSPTRTIPVRTQTPDSVDSNKGIITIGMAIGSPTHPPAPSYPDWPPSATVEPATSPPAMETDPAAAAIPQRSKSQRWKIFGRSKSKRQKPDTTPTLPDQPQSSGLDRSNTERKAPKHTPIIVRSMTEPAVEGQASSNNPAIDARSRYAEIPVPKLDKATSPFLDVEIPDIKMERYSVMFGNLLQNNPSSSSALLARRQATLDKLRTINDRIIQEEESKGRTLGRRATSPNHHARSPSLSLFPPPPSGNSLARSNTDAPTPSSPRFRASTMPSGLPAHPKENVISHKQSSNTRPQQPPRSTSLSQTAQHVPRRPTEKRQDPAQLEAPAHGFYFGPNSSSLILDSPTEEESGFHIKEQLRPAIQEPAWEMITPTPLSIKKASTPAQDSRSPSPRTTHTKTPSNDSIDDTALNAAVEISIARQISISHSQRKMLRTGTGIGAGRRPRPAAREPREGSLPTVEGSERLVATKMATPTLITPPPIPFGGSPLAQHRKSERIVVEGV
ncbi:conserved hypothetical protein [Verticillium alfalfae VaMs.102]|uniref:Uncharacterized protein n=1 Tax=Verticillium alfalfae (strain VaMs.102 / ATCC MYA-4576 / FGSC 10136) TaxID=526221 RepID=C9SK38_VERA1|nr:conserved hypothetical protein [Verticillium alfalfae VaMs.102]EEY19056.1 conserved hypothetical protein [Verticillium alfalfae VaMs.102]